MEKDIVCEQSLDCRRNTMKNHNGSSASTLQPNRALSTARRLRACNFPLQFAIAIAVAVPFAATFVPGVVPSVQAQGTTATLSGTATDDTGALVPGAAAVLRNVKNGSIRKTTSNSSGFFVFAAVPTGDYEVTVTHAGFQSSTIHGIHLDPQDSKTLSQVKLQVGEVTQVVNVSADDSGLTNSGEKSTLINASQINKLSVEGRDVGELVKTLPGFAIAQTSSGVDNAAYDPSQVNVTGALRSYAANGNSANGVSLLSDGSNVTDPGNYGDSVQNVNMDMVEEVKVQTSNFTAETSNGPIVVNAVGKSGGSTYHGELYAYARVGTLNSQDALSKYEGQIKPNDRFIYPGGNLGGPVRIPGTNFNRSKKLTFFLGAEDYAQRNIYAYGSAGQAIIHTLVPTAGMRTGDFSCPQILAYLGMQAISCSNGVSQLNTGYAQFAHISAVPSQDRAGHTLNNGQLNALDPNSSALLSIMPLPNRTNLGDGYNYVHTNLVNNDLYQTRLRLDEAFSDKIKLFGTYNLERGASGVPEVPYYSPSQTAPMGGIDTPGGGVLSTINSNTAGINLTIIPSAHLTNELLLNMTYFTQAFVPKNEAALTAAGIGYNNPGIFSNNGSKQYPQLHDYGYDGLPIGLFPDFSVAEPRAKKTLPSLADNVTYVVKTHTVKAGAYVQQVRNNQVLLPANSSTNGQIADYYYGPTYNDPTAVPGVTTLVSTSGNYLANFAEGEIEQFSQQNIEPAQNLYFWNVNFYATDSWKVTKNLTVDYGMRFEHLGPWQDTQGVGLAVYDPTKFANAVAGLPGLTWHAISPSVPVSGSPTRPLFFEPRVGMAYDVYGTGKTIFKGGFGAYRNHDDWNVVQPAAALAQGVRLDTLNGGPGISLSALKYILGSTSTFGSNFSAGSASTLVYALDPNDNEQPLTYTYSATLQQQFLKGSTLEIGYVGNHGEHLTAQNVNNLSLSLQNVNPVPLGAFFTPDPVTGTVTPVNMISSLNSQQINDYRPNKALGPVYVPTHKLYSFYNGLQTSWNKQTGKLNYAVSYTFSKVLGIKDGYYNGNAVDETNLRNNYGPLSFDRTHIFNTSYSYDFGKLYHGKRLIEGVSNGWALSGVTVLQSGPNLQATYFPNFNLGGTLGTGATALNVASSTFLGTPDVYLQPNLTCNPALHTKPNQYVNAACFQLPQIGHNGPFNFPYIHAPAYFDTDLTLAKSFGLGEGRNLQFRFAAFNFLNHPLTSFTTSFPQQIALNLSNPTPGGEAANPALATPQAGFGIAPLREGRRVVEVAAKFNF